MGYHQDLSITLTKRFIAKPDADAFQERVAKELAKAFDDEEPDQLEEAFDNGISRVYVFHSGNLCYDGAGEDSLIGNSDKAPSLKQVSADLACSIELQCYGEDCEDALHLVVENGEVIHEYSTVRIDLKQDYLKELESIADGVKKQGLEEEATRLRDIGGRIVAKYLFSN